MLVQSSEKPQALDIVHTSASKAEPFAKAQKTHDGNQPINKVTAKQEQVSVLSRWSMRGKLTQALAKAEYSETTLRQLYNALDKLAKQINTESATAKLQPMQQASLQSKITAMQQQAAQPSSGLDKQLKLKGDTNLVQRQLTANIDLLSAKPHDEKIQLLMGRSGKGISLQLPANQGEAKNLAAIQNAFSRHQISVELGRDNRILFSTSQEQAGLLEEPWVISGQGVRVAAGNPLSLQLNELDNPLNELAKAADNNDSVQAHRDKIKQVQYQLKSNLLKIQAQRKELAAQLQQIESMQAAISEDEISQLSKNVGASMLSSNSSHISSIMAQANVTRSIVRYSLY